MSIYLDDEAVELVGENLEAVLASARERLADAGRVVVEVQLDGHTLEPEGFDQAAHTEVSGREVRLYTAAAVELAASTLRQVHHRLEEAEQIQAQAAEHLHADEADHAMRQVGELLEIWLQTQQAVTHSAALLELNLNDIRVEDRSFHELTQELAERLRTLKDQLDSGDTVALADELTYEWPGVAKRWQGVVRHMVDMIES